MIQRAIGTTEISVSAVAMGCWPIAGITSSGVTAADSRDTLRAAYAAGINFFDTAYCYGYEGESERLIGEALGDVRGQIVIATKGGLEWGPNRKQIHDGRPERLSAQCDESLRRLGTDHVELYYLHASDPDVPLAESAWALSELRRAGKIRAVGVSNVDLEQLKVFMSVCRVDAIQPYYNMLQRDIERDLLPYCLQHRISVMAYWPLLKGLLAGCLARDHVFPAGDSRLKYPMFLGTEFERNLDFVDALRPIAAAAKRSVAELVINWTIHQSGITAALCGAKHPSQIRETAVAMRWQLTAQQQEQIEQAIAARGPIATRAPVS